MKRLPILYVLLLAMMALNSCKDKKMDSENPFFTAWDTQFGLPPFDKIVPKHYLPAFEQAMANQKAEIDSIVNNPLPPSFDNVILAWDNSGDMLRRVSGVFGAVSRADRNDELQEIEKVVTPKQSEHSDELMLNHKLFEKIKQIYDQRQAMGLDTLQIRLVERTYRNFVRSGAALNEEGKRVLRDINTKIANLRIAFSSNVFAENKKYELVLDSTEVMNMPSNVVDAARQLAQEGGKTGKYVFRLNPPSMIPLLTFSDRRDLREKIYKAYLERANHGDELDNKKIVNQIVHLRSERAQLLGYETHADYVLETRMAKNPANVYRLLDELWTPALERAKQELAEMQAIKVRETSSDDFQSWDWWYYAQKLSNEKYSFNQEEIRPYLSMQNVREGAFLLANRLYGTTFRPLITPLYNKECQLFEVLDGDNRHLGLLCLDYYTRESKRQGAWCGTIRRQSYSNGQKISPIVTIVCNFPEPVGSIPSLLSVDETETFFHEFGHALNNLFADVKYSGLYDYEYDMVELPSQIMENWAMSPELLRTYATHYSNSSAIPESLVENVKNSRLFNQGFITVEYLAAAYIDMDIYTIKNFKEIDVNGFEIDMLRNKRGLITQIEPRYHLPYFLHIMDGGYDANYYGYIWAEVLDKDAFKYFVEGGDLFNRKVARSFHDNILSKRGMVDGMDQYRAFRGAEPSRTPLLLSRGLIEPEPAPNPDAEIQTPKL